MNYDEKTLQKALDDIKKKKSLREAAAYYKIPKSTLHDKRQGRKRQKHGGSTALSLKEEQLLADGILKFSEWGFSMTRDDIRLLVKKILDRKGKKIKRDVPS